MNPQDRELFRSLHLRLSQLEMSLTDLKADFHFLERRVESPAVEPALETVAPPPRPFEPEPVGPPPLPAFLREEKPADTPLLPPLPTQGVNAEQPAGQPLGLESRFFRWLLPIGIVLLLITAILASTTAYKYLHAYLGPWSKLTALTLVSGVLITGGFWLERKSSGLLVYGRSLAAGGLACLYYTLYGATYVQQLHVNPSPVLGGCLLLAWSAWVLYLAEERKSELLSVFAIALAYFSSSITPVGNFTMAANLILAATAVIFLLRNAWTGLSYLCLIGTYLGYLRQIIIPPGPPAAMELLHRSAFTPGAIYLTGAWIIFTAGIFLAHTPHFAAGKRMAFLCLNNGAFAGLLLVAAHFFTFGHFGEILGAVGGLFLLMAIIARASRPTEPDLIGAYLTQGLALATGGIVMTYTGVTRGLLITVESVFLAAAGAYSRNFIFRIGGGLSALLGTAFLVVEIGFDNHYPWTLTFCGAAAMLTNAWFARRELWAQPREVASRFVLSAAFYTLLGLLILLTGIVAQPADDWIAPDLALAALALTAMVYVVPLFELPLLSSGLLVLGQFIAFFPFDDHHREPQWTQNIVALVTMLLVTWWPSQKLVPAGFWLQPLMAVYALAMVGFCYQSIHPQVVDQTWMILSALLSLGFLAYGAFARVWPFALAGQIFLGLSIYTFLAPLNFSGAFAWTWWAAAFPPVIMFLTAWLAQHGLPRFLKTHSPLAETLSVLSYLYDCMATALLLRWVFGVVPADYAIFTLLALGTGVMAWNLIWPSSYGVRRSFLFSGVGALNYIASQHGLSGIDFTWTNAFAFLLFLAQPALLRHWGREIVSGAESWAVIVVSSATAWFFISTSVLAAESTNLTLGWALFAIALVGMGFAANERRQRWCGLVVLAASLVRVAVHDFWLLTDIYRVITFFVLTVICLGLSFLYYKFADQLKEWL